MCLIGFAFVPHGPVRLTLAANRDEFHERATAAAHWWADAPGVFGGRDLLGGGGWLLVARCGRIAALTNFRQGVPEPTLGQPSRGALVADFVAPARSGAPAGESAEAYALRVTAEARRYAGFSLLLFDLAEPAGAWCVTNRPEPMLQPILPGVHVISNGALDAPWPKMALLRAAFTGENAANALPGTGASGTGSGAVADTEAWFAALTDESLPEDARLPVTGVGIARERLLAPVFVAGDRADPPIPYGTRSSSLIQVTRDGRVEMHERSWQVPGAPGAGYRDRRTAFRLDAAAPGGAETQGLRPAS